MYNASMPRRRARERKRSFCLSWRTAADSALYYCQLDLVLPCGLVSPSR
jgi:hypothetical protein